MAGVAVFNSGVLPNPTLTDAVVDASGSSTSTYGVWSSANTAITMSRVSASATGTGGASYAVINQFGSQVSMTDVRATASAPAGSIAGVYNLGATVQMAQVVAVGSGPAGNRYGIFNEIAATVLTADRCTFNGATNSVLNSGNSGVRIGGSQLVGLVTIVAGSATNCVLSYNGGYAPVNALCQ